MDLILEPLGTTIFIRALIASALVGIVCAVVGHVRRAARDRVHRRRDRPCRVPGRRGGVHDRHPVLPRRGRRGGVHGARDRLGHEARRDPPGHRDRRAVRRDLRARRVPVQHDRRATSRTCSASCWATSSRSAPRTSSRCVRPRRRRRARRGAAVEGAPVRDVRPARGRRVRDPRRPARVPVPRARRADDRRQPPGGRDHPRRGDAHHAGRDRAAGHGPLHPADARRGAGRHRQLDRRAVPVLLARRRQRRHDRPRPDRRRSSSCSRSGRAACSPGAATRPTWQWTSSRRRRGHDRRTGRGNGLVGALEDAGLPAHRAAPRGRRDDRRARRPLHRRRARRRGARPPPGARAGDGVPRPRPVRVAQPRGAGRPARGRPRVRRAASRPTITTRSAPAADGRSTSTTPASRRSSRTSAAGPGSASRPTGWSCSGCAPRARRRRRGEGGARARRRRRCRSSRALVAGACGGRADDGDR